MAKKTKKAEKPEILYNAEKLADSDGMLIEIMGLFNIDAFLLPQTYRWLEEAFYVTGNKIVRNPVKPTNPVTAEITNGRYRYGADDTAEWCVPMVYIADDESYWETKMHISLEKCDRGPSYILESAEIKQVTMDSWKQVNKIKLADIEHIVNDNMSKFLNEYTMRFAESYISEHSVAYTKPCLAMFYIAPQLEQISKAGYAIANKMLGLCNSVYSGRENVNPEFSAFERTFKPGSRPKDIFVMPKIAHSVLKDEEDIRLWDNIRKMINTKKIDPEDVKYIYESGYTDRDLAQCNEIMAKKYHETPVFTWSSLSKYLDRLDMFEAISRYEAFPLILDYLKLCARADIKPNINSDSLKREYDVTLRIVQQLGDEREKKSLDGKCGHLEINNYEEEIFFIRGIRDYADLCSEAAQQRSGITYSAKNIAAGKTWLYVMREKKNPDKSLVTVFLSPDNKSIMSQNIAYNRPVRSKAQKEFLKRWIKWINSGRPAPAFAVSE